MLWDFLLIKRRIYQAKRYEESYVYIAFIITQPVNSKSWLRSTLNHWQGIVTPTCWSYAHSPTRELSAATGWAPASRRASSTREKISNTTLTLSTFSSGQAWSIFTNTTSTWRSRCPTARTRWQLRSRCTSARFTWLMTAPTPTFLSQIYSEPLKSFKESGLCFKLNLFSFVSILPSLVGIWSFPRFPRSFIPSYKLFITIKLNYS